MTRPLHPSTVQESPFPMRHLTLSLAVVLLLAGCGGKKEAEKPAEATTPTSIAVQVQPADRGAIQTALTLSGDIKPALETQLASKVGGRLEYLMVDEGTRVGAGQVIGRIDPKDYQLQVLQAQASLASAQANRASAMTSLATAQDNANRLESLFKEGGVSAQQMISTRNQVAAARNQVAAADAQIAQARATIALNQSQLAQTDIKAPYAGVVTKKSAEVGTMLSPMTPVATLAATSNLELKVPVGQASLGGVRVGQPASFTVPTYAGRTFTAKVADISPTIDPKTRTGSITLRIPNPKGELAPGMFARVTLPTAARTDAILVSPASVVVEGEQNFVFVVEGEKAVRKPVSLGMRTTDAVEVTSGIQPGDKVVTLGQGMLQPDDRVHIVTEEKK
ncbi:Macrolide export protein MacA [compost metagenome]